MKTNPNIITHCTTCETAEPILEGRAQRQGDREEPLLRAGNTNCGGCGMSVALNWLSLAAGAEHKLQMVIPACCGIVTPGRFPNSAYGAPVVAATFASAAAFATGLAHIAAMNNDKTRVVCFAGDGGTYDIGMATLSAAAERNEDLLYICYDNEIYGNTGGQRSSATPPGARTTTTPSGKVEAKKDIIGIMAALTGLCLGVVAMRWALILSTAMLGTALVTSGMATLVSHYWPDQGYQAFAERPAVPVRASWQPTHPWVSPGITMV